MKRFGVVCLPYFYVGSMAILLFVFFYLYKVDANPPIYFSTATTIEPTTIRPGDTITLTAPYCKSTERAADSVVAFWKRSEDGLLWEIKEIPASFASEGCGVLKGRLITPHDMPYGTWQRVYRITYTVNPVAERTVEWESKAFFVMPTGEE